MRVDQVPELPARERIDAGGRLVQNQQVGVVDQRAAEAELLLHAARELAAPAGRRRGRGPVRGEQRGDARAAARRGRGRRGGAKKSTFSARLRSGRGSARAPAACRRCAGRPPRGGARPPCRRRAPDPAVPATARAPATSASSVDLPTPSGPISPTMRPAGISQRHPVERRHLRRSDGAAPRSRRRGRPPPPAAAPAASPRLIGAASGRAPASPARACPG